MMTCRQTAPSTTTLGALSRCLLLAVLAGGCEAEAVELAREIEAARGDCTPELLRASDEECVRMMERYAGMTADLMDTYIGGMRALDIALERMPPVAFDTAGLGYAISPEFRTGDPIGEGASPRLWPTLGGGRTDVPTRGARRRIDPPFGYDFYGRGAAPFADGFRYDIFDSGPYGYFHGPRGGGLRRGYDPYGYGGYGPYGRSAPLERYDRFRDFSYEPRPYDRYYAHPYDQAYGYEYGAYGYSPYGRPGPYAVRFFDNYGSYRDGRFEPYPPAYPYDGYGYSPGYGYYGELGARGARGYDRGYGLGGAYGRGYPEDSGEPYSARPGFEADIPAPAADWSYEPQPGGGEEGIEPATGASTSNRSGPAPARPPRHRPGILLPPEERLRRPWLAD